MPNPLNETPPPAERSRKRVVATVAAALVLAGVASAVWLWPSSRIPDPDPNPDDPGEPIVLNPGYLGIDSCAPCHAGRVAEFRKTNHYWACRRPEDAPLAPGFAAGRGTLALGLSPRFEMTHTDDGFFQSVVRPATTGENRSTAKIAFVYGAGKMDEVYFAWRGDELYELSTGWLHPQACWGNASWNVDRSLDTGREGTVRCLECHCTWFHHVPGTDHKYKPDSFIMGVTCERCHGPGRDHVAAHQANPKATAPLAIVQPALLSRERQLEVCTQCHGNSTRHRGPAMSYRPGQPLEDAYRTAVSHNPEDDHVANQIHYLRKSKCFQHSEMTCTTCHNPHKPTDHAAVQKSCLKCHEPAKCPEQPRIPEAVRSDCTGCHMPPRVWMNVHFHTAEEPFVPPVPRYDHRIAVHPEARDAVLLAWYRNQPDEQSRKEADRLTKSLSEHWLNEAAQRRREYRYLAAIGAVREALHVDPSPATREKLHEAVTEQTRLTEKFNEAGRLFESGRTDDAITALRGLLELKPNNAAVHAQLGKVYAVAGDPDRAVRQWREVARYDPNNAYGYIMIGWLALQGGRPEEAVEMYRKADEIQPYNPEITGRLGLGLLQLGRLPEAEAAFRKVLQINPTHIEGHLRLSEVLRKQARAEEAIEPARRAAVLTKNENANVLMSLAEAYSAAGKRTESEESAAKALAAAAKVSPEEVSAVKARLAAMRAGGLKQ
jgi:tetratricopeptide (TPR) repeat protein